MTNPKTYGLTHLAIAVHDLNRTEKFYSAVFEMVTMYHEKGLLQLTTPGCNDIMVFEEKTGAAIGETGGIAHFGFRLRNAADIEDIHARVLNAGGVVLEKGEFVPGSPY